MRANNEGSALLFRVPHLRSLKVGPCLRVSLSRQTAFLRPTGRTRGTCSSAFAVITRKFARKSPRRERLSHESHGHQELSCCQKVIRSFRASTKSRDLLFPKRLPSLSNAWMEHPSRNPQTLSS